MSKGSKQRPTDKAKFDQSWDRIFGRSKVQVEIDKLKTLADTRTDAERQSMAFLKNEYYDIEDNMQVRVQENQNKVGQCGCGRSPTGKCIGWHGLTEDQFRAKLEEYNKEQGKNT